MKKVVIVRGIPGSGKSSWLKENYPDAIVCSADHYFMTYSKDTKKDEYIFNPAEIGDAHRNCMLHFVHNVTIKHMFLKDTVLAVDNTNISLHDLTPYVRVAEAYGWDVEIVRIECDPEVAFKRNVHGVPLGTIKRMHKNLHSIPKYIGKEEIVRS